MLSRQHVPKNGEDAQTCASVLAHTNDAQGFCSIVFERVALLAVQRVHLFGAQTQGKLELWGRKLLNIYHAVSDPCIYVSMYLVYIHISW